MEGILREIKRKSIVGERMDVYRNARRNYTSLSASFHNADRATVEEVRLSNEKTAVTVNGWREVNGKTERVEFTVFLNRGKKVTYETIK